MPDAPPPPAPPALVAPDFQALDAALKSPPGGSPAAAQQQQSQQPAAKQQPVEMGGAPAEKPKEQAAAEEVKPAATEPRKKGLDAIPDEAVEKKEEAPAEKKEALEVEVDTKNWTKVQRDAFATARTKAKLLAQERDDARAKLAEMEKRLADNTPKDSEATLKELNELRTWKHAQDVRSSPEWKTSVADPIGKVLGTLDRIAERAKVDPEKLREATDPVESYERALAIKAVFESAAEPVDQVLITAALAEAEKLPPLYSKMEELENNAREVWDSLQNQTAAQKEAAAKEAEAQYLKSHTHIMEQLQRKMPSVFKDSAVVEDVRNARPGETPEDRAFEAQSAVLMPVLVSELAKLRAEVARLQESEKTLLGSRATVDTTAEKTVTRNDGEMDENALMAAINAGRR